ncbi:uncharacterized protein N7482_003904 [Penicillium canariense]|uniref:PH domain-containing protein n=1 Tax=Penicillium canariense TaxID=189055 RepID=A0A9W9LPR6_9EURO|nr:uncharacterized protein N7482_003904 [Penicillium canariense]KAJ5168310.1 hypothetical protein N7482_003904 [Penicillium canariense]
MSDVQKPVEETPAVVPATEPVAEAPAATETPAVEAPKEEAVPETAADETTATPEVVETAEAVKEEVKPASEGTLGYKAPGLVKGLRFAKRFFYFNDEAVEAKDLTSFHQNEKAAVANPIAAWASQTGKGLLFFTKRAEDKAQPGWIINLADVSDVTKEGSNEFQFKIAGQKHTFQAPSAAERDSWVVAIEAKSAEAKAEKETITSGEGYKAELEKLTKPIVAAVVAKKPEDKKEETAAPKEDNAEEATPKEEKKESAKSRSQSRKRSSIFGSLLGKKEEAEEKKETAEEAKPAEAVEPTTESAAEPAAEAAAVETTDAAAAAPAETAAEAEEKKEEKKTKRASIFGNFFQKVTSPSQEKSEKEATAPAEENPVSSTAPQLENPVEEADVNPIEPEVVTAPAVEGEAAKATEEVKESPAAEASTPKDKRRTSFFGNFGVKKEKKADTSDNEVTDGENKETKAKSSKLGGLFRKPSKAVKLDKEEVATAETDAKPEEAEETKETATETLPAATEEVTQPAETTTEEAKTVNVATSTPVQAAA